jgi:ketose-bisphosphate aldolase
MPRGACGAGELIRRAGQAGLAVPGFNIPYLPMMAPVVRALRDTDTAGLIMVARLEWIKFGAGGLRAIRDEYRRVGDGLHTRLHLDHVPVIDEDNLEVDYAATIAEALELGYDSVMVDGSRLPLGENIAATRRVVGMAHAAGVPVEAELGAVLGHEAGPLPPYEELFASRRGFTDPAEARRFVAETGVDWLSVAAGNIHGAISAAARRGEKPRARLDIEHLERLREAAGVPLVLHGGTGIPGDCLRQAMRAGIAKVNVATAIRQPYEALKQGRGTRDEGREDGKASPPAPRPPCSAKPSFATQGGAESPQALEAVYQTVRKIVRDELGLEGSARLLRS